MRERQRSLIRYKDSYGITPAYAGKTLYSGYSIHKVWDHPRVCGKDSNYTILNLEKIGSPPRMRERLYNPQLSKHEGRITPAYAGKTRG